jgi:predicted outer membrane repeat protein
MVREAIGDIHLFGSAVRSAKCAGGLYEMGSCTVTASSVSGNTASQKGAGIYCTAYDVSVVNSTISGNTGSGIFDLSAQSLTDDETCAKFADEPMNRPS